MTSNHKLFSEKFFNQLLTIIHKINKRIFEKSLPFANCNPQFKKKKNKKIISILFYSINQQ